MCASKGKSIKNTHMFYYLLISGYSSWMNQHTNTTVVYSNLMLISPTTCPPIPHPHYPIRITISTDYPLTIHCHITNPQHCTSPEIQIWPTYPIYPIPHPGPHPFWSPPRTAACPPPCTPGPAVHWARPPPGGRPWPRGPRPAAGSARTRRRSTWGRRRSTCRWCTATWVGSSGIKVWSKGVKVSFWWWKVELLGLRFGDGWFLGGICLLMLGGLLYQGVIVIVVLKQTFGSLTLQNIDAPISTYLFPSVHRHLHVLSWVCIVPKQSSHLKCLALSTIFGTWPTTTFTVAPGPGGPGGPGTRRWRRRTCSGGWPWPPPSARPPGRRGACGRSSAAAIPGRWPGASPWSLGGKDKKYIKSMKFAKITRHGWYLDVFRPSWIGG